MKIRFSAIAAGLTAAAVAGSLLVAGVSTATATTTPPWEPDSVGSVGSLTFYDAAGNVVTGGSVTSHPFVKYAVASTATPDTGLNAKAYLAIATPDGTNQTYNWSSDHLSSRTAYPNVVDPASVRASGHPYATGGASDFSLTDFFADYPNTQTGPEAGLYQVRLYTTSTSAQGSGKYFSIDISVSTSDPNATSGTWQVVYPAAVTPAVATAISTPVATPPSPAAHGAKVSLSAKVSATDKSVPAGVVHFFDGSTDLGLATYNGMTGVATRGGLYPIAGKHSYTARFTPTVAASYKSSTSLALAYVVRVGAAAVAKVRPRILGAAIVGRVLTAYRGVWSPAASSYLYTWKRGAFVVSHAAKYKVSKADSRKVLVLIVVAVRPGYLSGMSASLGVKVR